MSQETIRAVSDEELRAMQIEKNQAALALLRSWDDEPDDEDQVETLERLKEAIDENRPGQRKLFS